MVKYYVASTVSLLNGKRWEGQLNDNDDGDKKCHDASPDNKDVLKAASETWLVERGSGSVQRKSN